MFAVLEGAVYPLAFTAISQSATIVLNPLNEASEVGTWCGIFAAIAFYNVVVSYIRIVFMNLHGARLTETLRNNVMRWFMGLPKTWLDKNEGYPGLQLLL